MTAVLREFPRLFTTAGNLMMSVIMSIDTNTHAKIYAYLSSIITIFSSFFPLRMIMPPWKLQSAGERQAVGNSAEDCHRVETMLAGNLRLL